MTDHAPAHVLDHGHLQLIETWGSDEGIVEAARMSTNKGFKGWGTTECAVVSVMSNVCVRGTKSCQAKHVGDEKLLRYLYTNKHSTPFEMAGLTIEVQAPIFVFRQWHRHRTQSVNEMSARYTPLPDMNYMPSVERLLVNSKTNKQAGTIKGAAVLDEVSAAFFQARLVQQYASAEALYQDALLHGVPKELARVHLPVARYSRMRASANLRNWLGFLTLRLDPHAQYEIRVYAEALGQIIAQAFPRTWELFEAGRR